LCAALAVILLTASSTAQSSLPRFERGECLIPQPEGVRLDCGYVIAAESPRRSSDHTIRLAVAVFRSPQASTASPIVMLHGGPGLNGLRSPLSQKAAAWSVAFGRDVVVYDQRGSGLSEPRLCPEVVQKSIGRRLEELASECLSSLKKAGIDPTAYNTDNNAADATAVRRALGYRSWVVYGESYGSRLALELARRDAGAIRGLVLTSPLPPGERFYAEMRVNFQRALEKTFERCASQPACAAAFPTLEQDFDAIYQELNAQPVSVQVDGDLTVRLDGQGFVAGIRRQFRDDTMLGRVPLLINEVRRGNKERAARALIDVTGRRLYPTNALVVTQDICGRAYMSATERARAAVREPFRSDYFSVDGCDLWRTNLDSPSTRSPRSSVKSEIPALIFAAEFDDRTPVAYGRQIAAGFRSSHVYEIPGRIHGWALRRCEDTIVKQFLAAPTGRIDSSCIEQEPRTAFETRSFDLQRFVFRISDSDPRTDITGTWEAWVPGPQIVTTIELRIEGAAITGAIIQPRNTTPILDGRFERGTMTFTATSATGDRTVSLRGTVSGDEIHFIRDLAVRPGGDPGGEGMYGIRGPQTFVAKQRR
jgi:pimeloyl-ACP methyl ester carboxylesterase